MDPFFLFNHLWSDCITQPYLWSTMILWGGSVIGHPSSCSFHHDHWGGTRTNRNRMITRLHLAAAPLIPPRVAVDDILSCALLAVCIPCAHTVNPGTRCCLRCDDMKTTIQPCATLNKPMEVTQGWWGLWSQIKYFFVPDARKVLSFSPQCCCFHRD